MSLLTLQFLERSFTKLNWVLKKKPSETEVFLQELIPGGGTLRFNSVLPQRESCIPHVVVHTLAGAPSRGHMVENMKPETSPISVLISQSLPWVLYERDQVRSSGKG